MNPYIANIYVAKYQSNQYVVLTYPLVLLPSSRLLSLRAGNFVMNFEQTVYIVQMSGLLYEQ